MPLFRKTRRERIGKTRRKHRREKLAGFRKLLELRTILYAAAALAFSTLLVLVCFIGLSPAGPQILANQVAKTRVVAEIPFSYESRILTDQLIEQRRKRVPPVYRLRNEPFKQFEKYIHRLNTELIKLEAEIPDLTDEAIEEASSKFVGQFEPKNSYTLDPADVAVLLQSVDSQRRAEILEEGLTILSETYREGVYDDEHAAIQAESGGLSFFDIHRESGHIAQVEVRSEEDALRFLRINISFLDMPRELSVTLYHLMRKGLQPNLVYDQRSSEAKIAQVVGSVDPVLINVDEGQTIIEPGLKITGLDLERLSAYRQSLKAESDLSLAFNSLLWERLLMAIAVFLAAGLYLQVGQRKRARLDRELILVAILILLNLAIIRLILEIGDASILHQGPFDLIAVLPYLAPIALGPILVTLFLGPREGAFAAVLISTFNAIMQGSSIPVLLVSLLSSLIAIFFCRDVQLRSRVVRAGTFSGLSVAVCALFLGLHYTFDAVVIVEQIVVSLLIGSVTGIAALGFLPILEYLFKLTTSISLLELTDFNHPLLRRMQVVAPGSYHHSLMVANLSENAAAAVGANPLICRVCSLFHDIGKTTKPEYFAENQQLGTNPHIEKDPSTSALLIKSHVREGLNLAQAHKLPGVIADVIEQHHGTSLIQYFYYKALRQRNENSTVSISANAPKIELNEVNESTYRYDGPKPNFRESAIILIADSVEAASRSLKKVTPQSIQDLIDNIVRERLDDDQLSDCPLTFDEVKRIKKSFSFTLLNMLHARVVYPTKEEQRAAARRSQSGEKKAAKGKGAPQTPVPPISKRTTGAVSRS